MSLKLKETELLKFSVQEQKFSWKMYDHKEKDSDGNTGYYNSEDKLHREDGPAIEDVDGYKAWYQNDNQLTEEEFNKRRNSSTGTLSMYNTNNNGRLGNVKFKNIYKNAWSEGQEETQETRSEQTSQEIPQNTEVPQPAVVYPNVADIFDLHDDMIIQYGGTHGYNDQTENKLEAAIGRMQSGFGGMEFYKGILDKAAVLIHSIISTHPFNDGNKRTGFAIGMEFMHDNGYDIEDAAHLANIILRISTGDASLDNLIEYLNTHAKAMSNE